MSRRNAFDMFMESQRDSLKVSSEMRAAREDPGRRSRTKVFGQEAIRGSVKCFVMDLFAILFAFLAYLLFGALKLDLILGFKILLLIVLIGCSLSLPFATFFLFIRYFRYVRYQKAANDHPIGKRAKRRCVLALLFSLLTLAGVVAIIILALMSMNA